MAYKQPYNKVNKQGASVAPVAAAAPAAAGKLGTLLAKIGIGAKKGAGIGVQGAGKLMEGGGEVLKKGSEVAKKGGKKFFKEAGNKLKTSYNNSIEKIAKKLGEDKADVDKFVKNKAIQTASLGVSKLVNKTKNKNEVEDNGINVDYSRNKSLNQMQGYTNPQGPPMKYDNNQGASSNGYSSPSNQALNAIQQKKNDFISSFQAPVTINGVTFDAGDAVRAARILAIIGKESVEKRKANAPKRKKEREIKKGKRKENRDLIKGKKDDFKFPGIGGMGSFYNKP